MNAMTPIAFSQDHDAASIVLFVTQEEFLHQADSLADAFANGDYVDRGAVDALRLLCAIIRGEDDVPA